MLHPQLAYNSLKCMPSASGLMSFFFFSSRRRHTRSLRDWSSDLCSSDLEQGGIACVLADKNMPGMDGIEMLRRVREAQPHCAFIVMTGYASTESAIEALRLGAVDYLQKPFEDLDLVAHRIEDAIQQVRSDLERSAAMARLAAFQQGDRPAPED